MLQLYANIKTYRKRAGMTQAELARRAGYTDRSSIAKIERGDVDLSQSKIAMFAEIFEITPGELMGWDEETYNKTLELAREKIRLDGLLEQKKEPIVYDGGLPEPVQRLVRFAMTVPEDQAEAMLLVLQTLLGQFEKQRTAQKAD